MDARTPEKLLKGVNVDDLAIGIQVSAQVGPNRTISMTVGAPMAMTLPDLNQYVDKIMAVADRQNDKGLLDNLKHTLAGAEKDILTNLEQRAALYGKFELDWVIGKRKGDFTPSQSQASQLHNYDQTLRNLKDNIVPKVRKQITDLESKIAAGV